MNLKIKNPFHRKPRGEKTIPTEWLEPQLQQEKDDKNDANKIVFYEEGRLTTRKLMRTASFTAVLTNFLFGVLFLMFGGSMAYSLVAVLFIVNTYFSVIVYRKYDRRNMSYGPP